MARTENGMMNSGTNDPALVQLCTRERDIMRRRDDLIDQGIQAWELIEDLDREQDRLERDIALCDSRGPGTAPNSL